MITDKCLFDSAACRTATDKKYTICSSCYGHITTLPLPPHRLRAQAAGQPRGRPPPPRGRVRGVREAAGVLPRPRHRGHTHRHTAGQQGQEQVNNR